MGRSGENTGQFKRGFSKLNKRKRKKYRQLSGEIYDNWQRIGNPLRVGFRDIRKAKRSVRQRDLM